jgi:hypothetical protein
MSNMAPCPKRAKRATLKMKRPPIETTLLHPGNPPIYAIIKAPYDRDSPDQHYNQEDEGLAAREM